jgi:hypothetical protein
MGHRTSPVNSTQRPKVVWQLLRARCLAATLLADYPDPGDAHAMAEVLDAARWAAVAEKTGIDPPSPDTAALTVDELRHRAELLAARPAAVRELLAEWRYHGGWRPTTAEARLLVAEIDRLAGA